ncbi:MAG: helix-turn-helix transcriptional regulator [Armatimonas sp.]
MENFGYYLKNLRQGRNLTLGQVAQRSGISKATISRWETGVHVPRALELVEVMDALQLTDQERTACLRLLEVPRALHLERQGTSDLRLSLGDVLYALRQRSGMTQEELARRVGVSRSLCRKWEMGDSRPSDDQLHAVGFALGVPVDQVALLTAQTLSEEPLERSREALLQRYNETDLWSVESNAELSLLLLTLLAGFKSLLRHGRADAGDVALILASMATEARMRYGDKARERTLFQRAHRMALLARIPLQPRTGRMVRCLLPSPAGTAPVSEQSGIEKALAWRPDSRIKQARHISFHSLPAPYRGITPHVP